MNALAGWPDHAQAQADGIFGAFEGPGVFSLPRTVALAVVDGRPRLSLALFRREDDVSDGDGVLELELTIGGFGAGAPTPWRDGWLTTCVRTGQSADVTTTPVQPTGPAGLRATHRVDLDTALVLADAIEAGRSELVAGQLDIIVPAVAVRAAAEVSFDPAVLTSALAGATEEAHGVGVDWIVRELQDDAPGLGIKLTSGDLGPDVAAALADRLVDRFAEISPPADVGVPATFTFPAAPPASYTWNLDEPAPTRLVVSIPFGPLEPLATIGDRNELITRTTVPVFDIGGRTVVVRANLPDHLVGIDQVRARLRLPSIAGVRPAAQAREAIVYPASDPTGTMLGFRNGPGVPFSYERRVAALVAGVPEVIVSALAVSDRPVATITVGDLPFTLAPVSATGAVLALGDLTVTATYQRAGTSRSLSTALSAAQPWATLALPGDAVEDTLTLALNQHDGPGVIELGSRAFGPVVVDLDQIAAAGSHTVSIDVAMDGAALVAFELSPDDPSSPTPPEVLAFTPERSRREWRYVTVDPFRPGVRHRLCVPDGSPPHDWSLPHDHTAPLRLSAWESEPA